MSSSTMSSSINSEDTNQNKKRGAPKDDRLYEENTIGNNKKARQENNEEIDIFSVDIVATTIFSFLDMRCLLRVANTNNFLRSIVTYEHVIRGSMMHGGHAKQSMERLARLMEKRCIWIPSPLRLLRLVNGKRCENCTQGRANLVNADFGVFFCWNRCITRTFSKKVNINPKWSPYVRHPRVAKAEYYSNAYVWNQGGYKDKTGAMVGPLIGIPHMEMDRRGRKKLEELLEEMDSKDPYAKRADEIVALYKECQEEAQQRRMEKVVKKEQATNNAIERKKKSVAAFIEKLTREIGEQPWKEIALKHVWYNNTRTSGGQLVAFSVDFVNGELSECIKAPSRATKKKVTELKNTITETFDMIWEMKLHNFAFLSEQDEMEATLKAGFLDKFADNKHIEVVDKETAEELKAGTMNPLQYMVHLLDGLFFETRLGSSFDCLFAPKIVEKANISNPHERAEDLAGRIWRQEVAKDEQPLEEKLRAVYNICLDRFPAFYENVMEFINSENVKLWLEHHSGLAENFLWSTLLDEDSSVEIPASTSKTDYDSILEKVAKSHFLPLSNYVRCK